MSKGSANTQQWNVTVEGEHQGYKISGRRFGELTALYAVDRRNGNMLWLCRCNCGRVALRTANRLVGSERGSYTPMCSVCWDELRGGIRIAERDSKTQSLVKSFAEFGTLYGGDRWEKALRDEIVRVLVDEHEFPDPDEEVLPISYLAFGDEDQYEAPKAGGQRAAYLAPISGRLWRCCECGDLFSLGFACLACEQSVCRNCVECELHCCIESGRRAWESAMLPEALNRVLIAGSPMLDASPVGAFNRNEHQLKVRLKRLADQAERDRAKAERSREIEEQLRAADHKQALRERLDSIRRLQPNLAEAMGLKPMTRRKPLPNTSWVRLDSGEEEIKLVIRGRERTFRGVCGGTWRRHPRGTRCSQLREGILDAISRRRST